MRLSTHKKGVHQSIEQLFAFGVRDVVCSPGSRNAPIILALRAFPEIDIHLLVDERTAAFTALGMSMATGRPTGLCCTSGSAVANYYPAITEAFYQRIPMVLLTADRPAERIDQREGQSIRQKGLFTNHILAEQEINENGLSNLQLSSLSESLNLTKKKGGPIHWNYPLSEPLYEKAEYDDAVNPNPNQSSSSDINRVEWDTLKRQWKEAKKVLVIAGQNSGIESSMSMRIALNQFQNVHSKVGVFFESISNLGDTPGVPCIDRLVLTMGEAEANDLLPDLLISFDGEWVTRKVKTWLKTNDQLIHWHIDTYQFPSILGIEPQRIKSEPIDFLKKAHSILNSQDQMEYGKALIQSNRSRQDITVSDQTLYPWSDLAVFKILSEKLNGNIDLFNGNSSVIRYIQLFEWDERIRHLGNRGVSGIDGVTSTSIGYSLKIERETILISGDLAFLYDSNAFWQETLPDNFKIIVINNGGGGIFRIIEGPQQSGWLEEHFEQKHQRQAADIARMYGLNYFSATNEKELNKSLENWLSIKGVSVLEIFTPGEENDRVLKNYFKALKHGRP